MRRDTVRTVRWVIVGFGALAGIVLLAVGSPVIGVILLVMAVLRAILLITMHRPGRAGGRSGQMLQRLARNELDVAATTIGMSPDDLPRPGGDRRTIAGGAAPFRSPAPGGLRPRGAAP